MFVVLAKRSQAFQPLVDVFDEPALIVVHIYSRGNVHGGYQHHPLVDPALAYDFFYLGRQMNVCPMCLSMKFQVLGKNFHFRQLLRDPSLEILTALLFYHGVVTTVTLPQRWVRTSSRRQVTMKSRRFS